MSTHDKLLKKFLRIPSDFTFAELTKLLTGFGFILLNKGKTSGSRAIFVADDMEIMVHKPHGSAACNKRTLEDIKKKLKKEGVI